ncbi:MAG: hypothetical protein A2V90_06430 [Gammaproteobacteria bacterium RBG_16_57_12]|nr:MAG: hypothetical protein A2V90_06430 [Gammaproteobacteria bacterium RBG_16_57_12]
MRHTLARFLALTVLIFPLAAHAVGLGDIRLNSALDQPLDADIEMQSVQDDELLELKVGIAPLEMFKTAGVDYAEMLQDFEFRILKNPDSTPYIKIVTSQPVKEPFLNFLVELKWAKGRLVRQYTVLVDPPTLVPEKKPAPVKPAATTTPVAAVPAPAQTAPPAYAVPATAPAAPLRDTSGMTARNDTAWSIATRMRPDTSLSIYQVMLALLRENPQAFMENNVNNLKAGYILRLDNPDKITEISRADAEREIRRQYEVWKAAKSGMPVPVELREQIAGITPTDAQSATVAGEAAGSMGAEGAKLKLLSPGSAEGAGSAVEGQGAQEVISLRQELVLANEALEANKQENVDLQNRLGALDEQVQNMKRLLELKNNELASVKGNMAAAASAGGGAEPSWYDNPMLLAAVSVFAVLIGALAWVIIRRRRSMDFQESILNTVAVAAPAPTATAAGVDFLGEGVVPAGKPQSETSAETSLLTDFAMSAIEGIQTEVGEVDLISEADVYLAYGRYTQAEEIITQALAENPDREDLQFKLLEIHHASRDEKKFFDAAQALHNRLGGRDHPQWEKVVAMGVELNPYHPLLAGDTAGAGQVSAASAGTDAELPAAEENNNTLEFDLSGFGEAKTGPAFAAAGVKDDNVVEFDLGEPAREGKDTPVTAASNDAVEIIFAEDELPREDNVLEFNLGAEEEKLAAGDDDLAAFNLGDSETQQDDDLSFAGLDDVSTKLDLAKAYIDMEDAESARSMLDEVVQEGSDEQKQEAKALLRQIG